MTTASVTVREYFARVGARITDADARVIGPELERLGSPTADLIVDAARPDGAPLHPYLEWRDPIAAELYRHVQARQLARSIVVRVATGSGREQDVRAFHAVRLIVDRQADDRDDDNVGDDPDRVYVPLFRLQHEPDLAHQVVDEARGQLVGWQRRYGVYRKVLPPFESELGPIFEAIQTQLGEG